MTFTSLIFRPIVAFLLIVGLATVSGQDVAPAHKSSVRQPSDLKEPCTITNGVNYLDNYGTVIVTIVDKDQNTLTITNGDPPDEKGRHVHFRAQDGTTESSTPGSAEEKHLLRLMKESLAHSFTAAELKATTGTTKRYWTIYAAKRLIKEFEYRCATKQEVPPS